MTAARIRTALTVLVALAPQACDAGSGPRSWDDPACVGLALSGLPCSSGGGAEQVVTVRQLEDPSDPAYPGVDAHVVVRNVVITAVDTYDEDGSGAVGDAWVQDAGGGPWSGVQLYNPVAIPSRTRLVPGDIVDLVGTLAEFYTLSEITAGSLQKVGETVSPEPTVVTEAELTNPATAESWEGCLVRLNGVTMNGPYNSYGEATTGGNVTVADDLYRIPAVAAGTSFGALSGVVTFSFSRFKLLPRGPQDAEP